MTRLSRLTNILLNLQSRRVITAQQLADKFGISQRTVYRDIRALEEAGVPIIGEAGTGYCLVDDYRIPPVMFTEEEISALLTAQQIIRKNRDKSLAMAIDELVIKIKALLKYSQQERTEKLEQRVYIFSSDQDGKSEFLTTILSAITNALVVRMAYHSLYSDTLTQREVEPLVVYLTKDNWILIGYCRLRQDLREFRVDRIIDLRITDESFTERPFSFDDYSREREEK